VGGSSVFRPARRSHVLGLNTRLKTGTNLMQIVKIR
jgi:hypothetical protein